VGFSTLGSGGGVDSEVGGDERGLDRSSLNSLCRKRDDMLSIATLC
jgi:hypothetical protein